jgi:hypothetical protein
VSLSTVHAVASNQAAVASGVGGFQHGKGHPGRLLIMSHNDAAEFRLGARTTLKRIFGIQIVVVQRLIESSVFSTVGIVTLRITSLPSAQLLPRNSATPRHTALSGRHESSAYIPVHAMTVWQRVGRTVSQKNGTSQDPSLA